MNSFAMEPLAIEAMYALARRVARTLPATPVCDCDDLTQVGVMALMAARPDSERVALTIARRQMIDELRQKGGRLRSARRRSGMNYLSERAHWYNGEAFTFESTIADPCDALNVLERRIAGQQAIIAALAAMRPRERAVIVEYAVRGRLMREIAVAMGLSNSRIAQLISRARTRATMARAGVLA